MANVWNPEGEGRGMDPFFSRAFNDRELDLVEHLQKIQAIRVHRDVEDRLI